MLKPWDAYSIYAAIKLHFDSESYDAVKYNYKTSVKEKSFFARKDKYFFAKLAKRYPEKQVLINYYIANFVHRMDGKVWVGELVDTQSEDVYAAWLKIHDSLSYVYNQDIQKLSDYCLKHKLRFDQLFQAGLDGQSHPPIIQLFTQGEITLETVTILDILTNFMKRADKLITETILWPSLSRKLRKYRVFLQIDRKKMKEITLLWFTN
jgi:hypothetical protein